MGWLVLQRDYCGVGHRASLVKPKRFNIIWFLLAGILAFLIIDKANAQHECQGGHNCNDGGEIMLGDTSVETIIGGNDALGIGLSMGDVDINDCLASKSTPLYQWLVENKWCMADSLDARGLYEAAARVRCQTKTLKSVYPDNPSCIEAVTLKKAPENFNPVLEIKEHHEEDAERHQSEVRNLQAQLTSFVAEQKKANQRAARYATQQRQVRDQEDARTEQLLVDLRKISNE